jgi:hypothetical protein
MKHLVLCCCLLLPLAALGQEDATSIDDLLAASRLQVDTSVLPASGLVPGQRGRLVIEIATDRWFSGGTRIRIPEVPGLVLLQTEQFAANASETRNGRSWVIQRWTLDLYPQRAGRFDIPGPQLTLKVNGGSSGDIEGSLRAPSVSFEVSLPPALAQVGDEHWVAAPEFTVSQQVDRSLETLAVGDAFTRDISFQASDVLAMMLPVFRATEQPGLAAYPDPPRLDNSSNRGRTRARREQRITYLVEVGGTYRLPAQEYLWWNTTTGELQLLSLPAVEFTVTGNAATQDRAASPRQLAFAAALLAVLAGLAWLAYRLLPGLPRERIAEPLRRTLALLRDLRRPALPATLNPDNSVGD